MSAVRIGQYTLRNNLILAPMAGVTDQPFRTLCQRLGAGMVVSEMVSSDMSLWNSRSRACAASMKVIPSHARCRSPAVMRR